MKTNKCKVLKKFKKFEINKKAMKKVKGGVGNDDLVGG